MRAYIRALSRQYAKQGGRKKKGKGEGKDGKTVVQLKDVTKTVGGDRDILADVNVNILERSKIGLLGVNGCGKSSLLKIIAGIDEHFDGEVVIHPSVSVGYLAQEPVLDESLDVKSNIVSGLDPLLAEILLEYHQKGREGCLEELQEMGHASLPRKIEQAMYALKCPAGDQPIDMLSGGERRRIALCKLLISPHDLLLLDEPTNHLDASSVGWLEQYLERYRGTVVAVTHDRYFLDNVAGWIVEVDRGQLYPFRGNYTEWLEEKARRMDRESKSQSALQRKMKEELEWIRKSPKARQSKSKARIQRYDDLVSASEQYKKYEAGAVIIPPGKRLGDVVIEARELTMKVNDRILMDKATFSIPKGAIVGVIGPNGSGKSTFLRAIAGEAEPTSGLLEVGKTVSLGYVEQSREELDDDDTVYDAIAEGINELTLGSGQTMSMRAYVAAFHFVRQEQEKEVGLLSGGERNRVHLAKLLKGGHNVIMLDEPTNDLDLEVLRSLEDALVDFPGSAIVVSHDRWFLNRTCTHILAFEEDGEIIFEEGSYDDFCRRYPDALNGPFKKGKFRRL